MQPDDILEKFSSLGVSLTIRDLGDEVLIEGDRQSLMFLGELIQAQAQVSRPCDIWMAPDGPGVIYFSKRANRGLRIHTLGTDDPHCTGPFRAMG